MNGAAPQAPVAAGGTAAAGTAAGGRKRKAHHGGTPAALARGLAKGSAAFQQLLGERAARASALSASRGPHGRGLPGTAAAAENPGTNGLKKALADLLKNPTAHRHAGETPQDATQVAEDSRKHDDGSRKAAAAKAHSAAVAHLVAIVPVEAQPLPPAGAKEARTEPKDTAKAPAVAAAASPHRQEPLVRIVDLRRPHKGAAVDAHSDRKSEPAPNPLSDRDPSGGVARSAGPSRAFADTLRSDPAPAAAPPSPLDRLREMAGTELVRASTMVLKDGGGEIRLVLKPESLGSVRVRMNLVDNHIEGRIIVDSAAVKHVFDGSVDALRRALTADGFQMGSLQVSVGGQDAQRDQGRREQQPPEVVRRIAAQGFERSVPGAEDVSLGDLFVNLFV